MQLVLPFEHMAKAAQYMEPSVFEYVREGEIESFESFEKFDFLAFDWYDVHSERTEDYKMLAYVSRENLIIFTEGAAGDTAKKIMDGLAAENPELRSEQLLYRFFVRLLNGDMDCLSRLENEIDEYENVYLFKSESGKDVFEKLSAWRRELLRIKRYYEQLTLIFDEASANDNSVFSNSAAKRFAILKNRAESARCYRASSGGISGAAVYPAERSDEAFHGCDCYLSAAYFAHGLVRHELFGHAGAQLGIWISCDNCCEYRGARCADTVLPTEEVALRF